MAHNCRCTSVPHTKSWADLGIDGVEDSRPEIVTGPVWFAGQPAEFQEGVLGPRKYALYKAGDIELEDLVGEKRSPKWGRTLYEKSLRELEL